MLSWKESLTTHHKRAATLVKTAGYQFLHFIESSDRYCFASIVEDIDQRIV